MSNKGAGIEVRMMRRGEEAELLAFKKANLDTYERFEKLWKWKQDRQEISGGETAAIAKYNDRIVGCVGVVSAGLTSKGQQINASWQQDSLVSKTMRGKGLGKRLVEVGVRGWDLVVAKGTSQAMYGLRKSMGFVDVPNSDYLVRVERPRIDKGELKKSAVEIGLLLWQKAVGASTKGEKIELKPVESFDRSFDWLAERVSNKAGLRVYKTQQYLDWRYVQCPGKRYQIFRAGGADARGAIVLDVTGAKRGEGWFVDLICPACDEECAHALIREGLRYFRQRKVARIYVFSTLPEARKWFQRFGFVATGRSPKFTYKVCGEGVDPGALNGVAWDFWHGDGDVELYM